MPHSPTNKYQNSLLHEIKSQGFVPMKAPDAEGRIVLTHYYINPNGQVGWYSNNGFKLLRYTPDKDGYDRQSYTVNGKHRMMFRQRLIAINFLQEDKERNVVNHKDLDKCNNHVHNLEWCTVQENATHYKENRFRAPKRPDYPIVMLEYLYENKYRIVSRFSAKAFIPLYIDNRKIQRAYVTKNCLGHSQSYHGYVFVYAHNLEEWKRKNNAKVIK